MAEARSGAGFGGVPKGPERASPTTTNTQAAEGSEALKELKQEIMDLRITNRAKDMFIERLQKERETFAVEREGYVEKLMTFNRKVGELETKLLQLSAPAATSSPSAPGQ